MSAAHTAGPWVFDPTHNSEMDGTGVDVGQIITTDAMVRIVALCEATNMPSALGADISHIARQALVKALPTKGKT